VIPVPGGIEAGELEHHHGRVEIAFERVHPSAMHEEASAEGFERGIDPAQVVRDLLVEVHVPQVGHRVALHQGLHHSKGLVVANQVPIPRQEPRAAIPIIMATVRGRRSCGVARLRRSVWSQCPSRPSPDQLPGG